MQHSNQQPSLTLTCVDRVLSQAFHKHQKKASADPNYKGPNGMFQGMGPGGMIMQYEHMHTWFCGQEGNKVKAVCNKEKKAAKGPHPLFAKNHAAHNDWMEMANGCVLSVYGTSAPVPFPSRRVRTLAPPADGAVSRRTSPSLCARRSSTVSTLEPCSTCRASLTAVSVNHRRSGAPRRSCGLWYLGTEPEEPRPAEHGEPPRRAESHTCGQYKNQAPTESIFYYLYKMPTHSHTSDRVLNIPFVYITSPPQDTQVAQRATRHAPCVVLGWVSGDMRCVDRAPPTQGGR